MPDYQTGTYKSVDAIAFCSLHEAATAMTDFLRRFECNGGCGRLIDWRTEARALLKRAKEE